MNRREFLGSSAILAGVVPTRANANGERQPPTREQLLEPTNLVERIRLGQNALLGGLDSTESYLPYWSCRLDPKVGFSPHHAGCRDHDVGRALHGLSMAEEITGWHIDETVYRHLADYLFALFDAGDGLPGTVYETTGKYTVNLHNVREAINGLTALIKRGDDRAAKIALRLVTTLRGALDDTGKLLWERLPSYVRRSDERPGNEGRSVDALVRYHRATGNPTALETASLITAFALDHCFTPEGALTALAGGHGHSVNALVAGMLDFALLTNDKPLMERARRVFDFGLPSFNTNFGWSLESALASKDFAGVPRRGEVNNTADLLRSALVLGRAGYPEYYSRAERILRGHLLPSQLLDVTGFSDNPAAEQDHLRSIGSRIRGGFGFTSPSDGTFGPIPSPMVYDITSGGVDGLCEAWHAIIREEAFAFHVNLLLTATRNGVAVKSDLSREGHVEVVNQSGRNVLLYVPAWVSPQELHLDKGSAKTVLHIGPSCLLIPGNLGPVTVQISFPMKEERTVENIFGQQYTINWRGDQIVGMCPSGKYLPMFPPCK